MLATNTSHTILQISWVVTRHKKKWKPRHSLSLETHKAISEFWLQQENAIVSTDRRSNGDEVLISKLEYLRDYAHCTNINDTEITEKEVVAEKDRNEEEIHDSPANGLHPSIEENLPSFCRNRICIFHQHVYKIQAILYHIVNRKRERIVPLQKMFKRASPCRHQQLPKSPKTSSAWSQNKISGMLRYERRFFSCLWKEGGNLFQKWNIKKLRTCHPYW